MVRVRVRVKVRVRVRVRLPPWVCIEHGLMFQGP